MTSRPPTRRRLRRSLQARAAGDPDWLRPEWLRPGWLASGAAVLCAAGDRLHCAGMRR